MQRTKYGLFDVSPRIYLPPHADPTCVLFVPLYKHGPETPFPDEARGHLITRSGATPRLDGFSFDGVDDKLNFGDESTLAWMHGKGNTTTFQWTIIAYLKLNNPGGIAASILDTGGYNASTSIGIAYTIRPTTRQFDIGIFRGVHGAWVIAASPSTVYPDDTNYHQVALTYDQALASANATFYLDRKPLESLDKTASAPANANSSYIPTIGRYDNGAGGALDGIMAELSVYKQRVFTPLEIANHGLAAKRRMPWLLN